MSHHQLWDSWQASSSCCPGPALLSLFPQCLYKRQLHCECSPKGAAASAAQPGAGGTARFFPNYPGFLLSLIKPLPVTWCEFITIVILSI